MKKQVFAAVGLLLFACVEDRLLPEKPAPIVEVPLSPAYEYGRNSLLINEFIASACKGSEVADGSCLAKVSAVYSPIESRNGKWIELYNPGDTALSFASGNWFVTDDTSSKSKFQIPKNHKPVPPKGLAIICTDNSPAMPGDSLIHAPFSMARYSGHVAVFYRKVKSPGDTAFLLVDELEYIKNAVQVPLYDSTARHISYGRKPDGNGGALIRLSNATPGKTN